mmetsp:Transcript_124294/g.345989  ORF Transcript_124294/g.345989 Transcript_124294/m.345989 type:complete len:203 (-) Transcript_124294:754-1362(-)
MCSAKSPLPSCLCSSAACSLLSCSKRSLKALRGSSSWLRTFWSCSSCSSRKIPIAFSLLVMRCTASATRSARSPSLKHLCSCCAWSFASWSKRPSRAFIGCSSWFCTSASLPSLPSMRRATSASRSARSPVGVPARAARPSCSLRSCCICASSALDASSCLPRRRSASSSCSACVEPLGACRRSCTSTCKASTLFSRPATRS